MLPSQEGSNRQSIILNLLFHLMPRNYWGEIAFIFLHLATFTSIIITHNTAGYFIHNMKAWSRKEWKRMKTFGKITKGTISFCREATLIHIHNTLCVKTQVLFQILRQLWKFHLFSIFIILKIGEKFGEKKLSGMAEISRKK